MKPSASAISPSKDDKPHLLATYEILTYYEMAAAIRCFVYPEFIRCGALWLAPRMPRKLSLRDRFGNKVAIVVVPEQFRGLSDPTVTGDGHPQKFMASPSMTQLEVSSVFV